MIKVGDYVHVFKGDYVKCGYVTEIKGDVCTVELECPGNEWGKKEKHEAKALKSLGATVLKIVRLEKVSKPEHASEEINFDVDHTLAVMENNWTVPFLIASSSRDGYLNYYLSLFDWNRLTKFKHIQEDFVLDSMSEYFDIHRAVMLYYGHHLAEVPKIVKSEIQQGV